MNENVKNTIVNVNSKNDKLSNEQNLELQSKLSGFLKEVLVYDRGYVVFELVNMENFEFDYYYSSQYEMKVRIEETNLETVDRILFAIDCEEFNAISNLTSSLPAIIEYLRNYVIGMLSANMLFDIYGIGDHSYKFREHVDKIIMAKEKSNG